jgi:leader peptidase (prepilin peptidase) / N-methyltransferase
MILGTSQLAALGVLVLLTSYAAVVDIRSMIIPDTVNVALFGSGLATTFVVPVVTPVSALLASGVGAALLFLVETGFRAYRGYDGLGRGDVKFVAGAATWIGLEGLPFTLLAASVAALVYVALRGLLDRRFEAGAPIPFGPFLGLGVVCVAAAQLLTGMSVLDLMDAWLPPMGTSGVMLQG